MDGAALNASLVDMGNRFRLLVNEVEAVKPANKLPKLPVARVFMETAAWTLIQHVLHGSMLVAHIIPVTARIFPQRVYRTFAEMAGIEFVLIDKNTTINNLKKELRFNDVAYLINK
jgi:L-arabinose isomerase